ncbi:MAG: hypothetical protein QXM82_01080 [Ignisphaera sp.]
MAKETVPISVVQLMNIENIPLSLCCVSGLALVVNFIQCPVDCSKCLWESNITIRSAKTIEIGYDSINQIVNRYNPDIVFLHGGEPWRYRYTSELLLSLNKLDILKGIKVNSIFIHHRHKQDIIKVIELSDIVLIEVISNNIDIENIISLVEKIYRDKHVELVVIYDLCQYKYLEAVIKLLKDHGVFIPINISLIDIDKAREVYRSIELLRKKYPLVQTINATVSEYSSVLCTKCRLPIIIREGAQVIKIELDNECRCRYCGYRVINVSKNICRARKMYRLPIRIPLM